MKKIIRELALSGAVMATSFAELKVEAAPQGELSKGVNKTVLVASRTNERKLINQEADSESKNFRISNSKLKLPNVFPASYGLVRGEVYSMYEESIQPGIQGLQNESEVQNPPANSIPKKWEIHGFAEQQFRPGQDFQSTSIWAQLGKRGSKWGLFNFSQFASGLTTKRNSWGQSYAGPYIASDTKLGYLEGGVAAGLEVGSRRRFAAYGVLVPKRSGLTVLGILERGRDKNSFWKRLEAKFPIGNKFKVGYHNQTGLGQGISGQWDPDKKWQVLGVITYDKVAGKLRSMLGIRRKF